VCRGRPGHCSGFFSDQQSKDTTAIARRPHNAPPTRDTGPRVNDRIRANEIRLIGAEGENIGVITPEKAMVLAEEAGLDLAFRSHRQMDR
jgi:translation initiation factor IF-3